MTIPTIRQPLQPNLSGTPRASVTPGVGAALEEIGNAGMSLALAEKRAERREAESDLRSARAEAAERLGILRAKSNNTRTYAGMAEAFNGEADAVRREIGERFGGDEEMAERWDAVFAELRAPHTVGVTSRELQLRVNDDRLRVDRDANRMLRTYGAEKDPEARKAIATSAADMIDEAVEKGILTEEEGKAAAEKWSKATERGELAGAINEDPEGMLKALTEGKFEFLTPVERQQMIGQAKAAVKSKEREAETERLEGVEGELRRLLREDPAEGAKQLEKKGALGLSDDKREAWRTRMLAEVDQQAKEAKRAEEEPARASAIELIDQDPERFLDMAERGFYDNLPPAERARMKVMARNNLERQAEAAKRADDKITSERNAVIDAAVDVAEKSVFAGRPLEDPDAMIEAAKGTPSEARMNALVAIERRARILRGEPASKREAIIEAVQARGASTEEEVREVKLLRTIHDEMRKAELADIWKFREDHGYGPAPEVNFGDPESLRVRLTLAQKYAKDHEVPVRFFSEREATAVAAQLTDGARDTEDKLSILTSITGALGANANVALAEIGLKEPVYARAGFLMAYGGDPATAVAVVTGYEALKAKEGPTVPAAIRDNVLVGVGWETALPARLGAFRENIIQAARAHYAATMRAGIDKDEISDADKSAAFARSINAVLGGRTIRSREYGGIQEVNGIETVLPPSLNAEHVENILTGSTDEVFAAAMLDGAMPVFATGGTLDEKSRGQLVLQLAGPNQYLIGIQRNGAFLALRSGSDRGRPAIIDLDRLNSGVVGATR